MIFSEVTGTYFTVLSRILSRAVEGGLTRQELERIVRREGFGESILTIPEKLLGGSWPLLTDQFTTPLRHKPTRPLTLLEKRWMKALLQDPRIRLFDPPAEGLEDVEPLYPKDAILFYDRYADGDPFDDPDYIAHFRTILTALREKRMLHLEFRGKNGDAHCWDCVPHRLEYSPKDDKFRLITGNSRTVLCVNLARITGCALLDPATVTSASRMRRQTLKLELTDERNALERAMLHFSHLEKQTERIGENRYRLTLRYDQGDETELLIRVLSFGPALKVVAPEKFKTQLLRRLRKQQALWDGSPDP